MTLNDLSFSHDIAQTNALHNPKNLAQSHNHAPGSLLIFQLLQRGHIQYSHYLLDILELLPFPAGIKDCDSAFIYSNAAYIELAKLPPCFRYEGKQDAELPTPFCCFSDAFKEQDQIVLRTQQAIKTLDIHRYGAKEITKPYVFHKIPLHDANWKVIGTFFIGLDPMPTLSTCYQLARLTLNTGNNAAGFNCCQTPVDIFNRREWEVVYLLANGITRKEIAAKLNISSNTVNSYLQSAIKSTHTGTAHKLTETIKGLGWLSYIPESLLTPSSIII